MSNKQQNMGKWMEKWKWMENRQENVPMTFIFCLSENLTEFMECFGKLQQNLWRNVYIIRKKKVYELNFFWKCTIKKI